MSPDKSDAQPLDEMVSEFEIVTGAKQAAFIPREKVMKWMQSQDLEVLGALYTFLVEKRAYQRVTPLLSIDDYQDYVFDYFKKCLLENPSGEWSHSRYEAAWEVAIWFVGWWDDATVSRQSVSLLKEWLADFYRRGNTELRTCIVTGTLEHLFERPDIQK